MACGKSTLGPVLAEMLDRPFIDLDHWIVAKAGCAIAELIAREGESTFRRMETETLREAAEREQAVIAPGGGAIMRLENRELMSRLGRTIWLDAPFELCWQRIREDQVVRPLAPNEATARARYRQRTPLYELSDIRISINETQTPREIAEAIISKLPLSDAN